MYSNFNSDSILGDNFYFVGQTSFGDLDAFSDQKNQDLLPKVRVLEPTNQNISTIRSNKNIIRKHLRNSLVIPKMPSFLNLHDQKNTASSLTDLCQISDSPIRKKQSDKENSYSSLSSTQSLASIAQNEIFELFDGKYTVLKKIGQGAHSTVYKCLSALDNKFYALKRTKNVSFQNWRRLLNLYRMIKSLDHKNILGYYDYHFDQQKKTAYVVMEFCEFPDLRHEISKKSINGTSFTSKQILKISKQIAEVLKYLHEEGICHRDLKPENILYNRSTGAIKLIDLDVCGVKRIKSQAFDMWTFTGTLFYRAPESFEIGYSEKVDTWGLGIVAYELAKGSLPFLTEYQKDFVHQVQITKIDFESLTKSEKLNRFIRKCLQKNPVQRASAQNLCEFLSSKIKDDWELISTKRCESTRRRSSYTDTYVGIVCLGSLLKLTV